MRDINDVLRQKQTQLDMVRREIQALELVIAMLKDDDTNFGERVIASTETREPMKRWP